MFESAQSLASLELGRYCKIKLEDTDFVSGNIVVLNCPMICYLYTNSLSFKHLPIDRHVPKRSPRSFNGMLVNCRQ